MKITNREYADFVLPAAFYASPGSVGAYRERLQLLEKIEAAGVETGPTDRDGYTPRRIGESAELDLSDRERTLLADALAQMLDRLPVGLGRIVESLADRVRTHPEG
jgi:hypothetical protein